MRDASYYEACAVAALQALITKMPLFDREEGDDVSSIVMEVAKSADDYATCMVQVYRARRSAEQDSSDAKLVVERIQQYIANKLERLERRTDDYCLGMSAMLCVIRDMLRPENEEEEQQNA